MAGDSRGRPITIKEQLMKRYLHIMISVAILLTATCVMHAQTEISGTINGATWASGSYKLTNNTTTTEVIYITGDVTLDLNGYTLARTGNGQAIQIRALGHTATIKDSNPERSNTGTFGLDGASVTIKGGVIHAKGGTRGGVIFLDGGHLIMEGGTLAGGKTTTSSDPVYGCGGGVYVNRGAFTMDGGNIAYCQTTPNDNRSKGGAVFINGQNNSSATFTLKGTSKIYGCKSERGGGVYVHTNKLTSGTIGRGYFDMEGGSIENCTATLGGGVMVSGGSEFTMSGGTISGNNADTDNEYWGGGGIFINQEVGGETPAGIVGRFRMSGGNITGNTTRSHGCGIHATGIVEISGGTISGNKPSDWNEYEPSDWNADFTEKTFGGGIYVRYGNAGASLTMTGGTIENNVAANGGGVYIRDGINFNMSSGMIRNNRALTQMAIKYDETDPSKPTRSNGGGGVFVSETCHFTLSGGEITENKTTGFGNGVNSQGTFTMNGNGSINNNRPADWKEGVDYTYNTYGGGVFIYSTPTQAASVFNMTGGTISDNIGASGGAVMVYDNSTFNMSGGTLSGNTALGTGGLGNGGAIYVNSSTSTFEFNGGTISGNSSLRYGGAININAGANLILNAGTIQNNSSNYGGGISQETGSCSMNVGQGIILKENIASQNGGGLFVEMGEMTLNGCTIDGNTASGNGGGIALSPKTNSTGSTIVLIQGNATISNNIADQTGGAVYLEGGDITVNTCSIDNNTAGVNGGALSIKGGSVNIQKGEISYNSCAGMGGGVFVSNETDTEKTVTLSGDGSFTNNVATYGGGLYVSGKMSMIFQGNIESNVARCGGGILLDNGSELTITGGIIRNNKAIPNPADPDAIDESTKPVTGYGMTAEDVYGMGGGIFIDSNSTLEFDIQTEVGVYENDATWGADDIFANGVSTSVTLPDVKSMNLTGYRVPTTELYWAEDYIEGDRNYNSGTNLGDGAYNYRYDHAILNSLPVYDIKFEAGQTSKTFNGYLSLEIGYVFMIVDIIKKGLKEGESAVIIFTPARHDDGDGSYSVEANEQPYLTVLFVGDNTPEDGVVQQVALPSGWWEMKENDWSWAYENSNSKLEAVTLEKQEELNVDKLVYVFENVRRDNLPETSESVKINRMRSTVR